MQDTPSNAILLRLSVTQFSKPLIKQHSRLLRLLPSKASPPIFFSSSKLLVALVTALPGFNQAHSPFMENKTSYFYFTL